MLNLSYEITTNSASKVNSFSDILPLNTEIYIPHIKSDDDFVPLIHRLILEGMKPIPHMVVRNYDNMDQFQKRLEEISDLGIRKILLLAGSSTEARGIIHDTFDVVDNIDYKNITNVSVAGFPQGNLTNTMEVTTSILKTKLNILKDKGITTEIVTQFVLKSEPFISYIKHIREQGITDNIRCGIIAPTNPLNMAKMLHQIGFVEAANQVISNFSSIFKICTDYDPDKVIKEIYYPNIHIYNFGNFNKTVEWSKNLNIK